MPEIHVPEPDAFASQLSLLIGKELTVSDLGSSIKFEETAQSAVYITREDHIAAIMRLDLALAAHLGAALAMMPSGAAEEAILEGDLGEDLFDAYREVVNIMAGLLCRDGSPHVRLASVNECDASYEAEFMQTLADPCVRLDLEVDIEGYGSGRFTLRTARMEKEE